MKKITKLSEIQKRNKSGGSFYAIALGIGILISTLSSLIMNAVNMSKPAAPAETNYGFHRTTVMRLSPIPSRSSFAILG